MKIGNLFIAYLIIPATFSWWGFLFLHLQHSSYCENRSQMARQIMLGIFRFVALLVFRRNIPLRKNGIRLDNQYNISTFASSKPRDLTTLMTKESKKHN